MDGTDLKILEILSRNAREKYKDISKMMGVATSTIHNRVQKMVEGGLIERFTIIPDPMKMGHGITTYVGVNIDHEKKEAIIDKLVPIGEVLEIYELLEPYDLFIKARTDTIESLKDDVLRVISEIDGVSGLSSILTTKRYKEVTCNISKSSKS